MAQTPGRSRQKRRIETEQRLRDAVEELICERGVEALGVNAVAAQAGVDKALIYRYFGGLPGLVEAYAQGADFWPTLDEILGPDRELLRRDDVAEIGAEILRRHAQALRSRPHTLEILARECVERGPLTIMLEEVRERRTEAMYAEMAAAGYEVSPIEASVGALFAAAINYLAIRSRFIKLFGGADLGSDDGWDSIIGSVEAVFRALRRP
jgi:AcrR family transcriptional regulator